MLAPVDNVKRNLIFYNLLKTAKIKISVATAVTVKCPEAFGLGRRRAVRKKMCCCRF